MKREDPKQELRNVCKCKRAYENPLSEICSLCWNELYPNEKDEIKEEDLLEPKQETLEEAAERFSKKFLNNGQNSEFEAQAALLGVQFGAEWQKERLYTEEEVENLIYYVCGEVARLQGIILNGNYIDSAYKKFKK